ncbi:hypothetical protein NHX12_005648, partial [Muraenolepis orangiensis]
SGDDHPVDKEMESCFTADSCWDCVCMAADREPPIGRLISPDPCQRCHCSLAQTLGPQEAPVDRPFWGPGDPAMALPFDLAGIVNRVESLLWRPEEETEETKEMKDEEEGMCSFMFTV